ncbi:hypothetical protein KKH26_03465 [Patescibacteria group bacterium]|nr:hypothetical protein [Patescibacteria group bacterium]
MIACAVFGLLGISSISWAQDEGGQNELSQNLDPVFFVTPKEWQLGARVEEYEYMFVTTAADTGASFTILVRRLNVPGQDARKWAEDERSSGVVHGAMAGGLEETTIGKMTWYVVKMEKAVAVEGQSKPLMMTIRQYFSKAAGSNTIVEVAVTAVQGTLEGSFTNDLTDFLSSFKNGKDLDGALAKAVATCAAPRLRSSQQLPSAPRTVP